MACKASTWCEICNIKVERQQRKLGYYKQYRHPPMSVK